MEEKLRQAKQKSSFWGWVAFVTFIANILYGIAVSLSWVGSAWYVWVLLPLLSMLLIINWAAMQGTYQKFRKEHLVQNGKPATARLVRSVTTGANSGTSTVMKLYLELTDNAGEVWNVEIRKSLSPDKYYLLQPNTVFKAWYLPENRKEITIDGLD